MKESKFIIHILILILIASAIAVSYGFLVEDLPSMLFGIFCVSVTPLYYLVAITTKYKENKGKYPWE